MTAEKMNIAECKNSKKSKILVSVLVILFKSSIGVGIGNTFQKQYWYRYW